MQVILLERIDKLGVIGDEVSVKNGFGRNYLIPQGKALMANAANRARFEREREYIEQRNAEAREAAAEGGQSLDGESFILIRQAGESGQLYGSVQARDICEAARDAGHKVARNQVRLDQPIKSIGVHHVKIRLHAEVSITITVNVARTPDEAERQASGEDVLETLQAEQRAADQERAGEMAEAQAEMADQMAAEED